MTRGYLRRLKRLVGIVAKYTIARADWAMYQNAPDPVLARAAGRVLTAHSAHLYFHTCSFAAYHLEVGRFRLRPSCS